MPIDHLMIRIQASKWEASKAFYEKALKPIGYSILKTFADGDVMGLGENHPDLWVVKIPDSSSLGDHPYHFAFRAESKQQVDEFHTLGIASGGEDNGPAGPRPNYGPTYYGAFVKDPAGNNIEIVTHLDA
ncbi:hypothetical protein H072_9621 [Dactylellina haptotyla CBS 200.50]|uniref:VOC domain-containing protein n=1 Tax=Dactylellina haptotyla (strain CBS 200.50) TaxID=1284197 RepID=S8A6U1_DACHA|nr:hypothetical protein H072_9621 [Dactylellina haptotyla CBS 200.50]